MFKVNTDLLSGSRDKERWKELVRALVTVCVGPVCHDGYEVAAIDMQWVDPSLSTEPLATLSVTLAPTAIFASQAKEMPTITFKVEDGGYVCYVSEHIITDGRQGTLKTIMDGMISVFDGIFSTDVGGFRRNGNNASQNDSLRMLAAMLGGA